MITVTFKGGPRHGITREYPKDPRSIGCRTECDEAGIPRGVYQTKPDTEGVGLIATWHVPKRKD